MRTFQMWFQCLWSVILACRAEMQLVTENKSCSSYQMPVKQLGNHKEKNRSSSSVSFICVQCPAHTHTHLRWVNRKGEMSLKLLQGASNEHKSQELSLQGWRVLWEWNMNGIYMTWVGRNMIGEVGRVHPELETSWLRGKQNKIKMSFKGDM